MGAAHAANCMRRRRTRRRNTDVMLTDTDAIDRKRPDTERYIK